MKLLLPVVTLVVASLLGCSSTLGDSPGDKGRGTVRLLESGFYIVSYKWPYVEKVYGKDRYSAVPAYLEANGLVPTSCARGIHVLRGGEGEGGWGWAEFRCKQ